MAAARHERRLLVVACKPLLGAGAGTGLRLDAPAPLASLPPPTGPRHHALGAHALPDPHALPLVRVGLDAALGVTTTPTRLGPPGATPEGHLRLLPARTAPPRSRTAEWAPGSEIYLQ